jgi:hypothetical protein
MDESWLEATPTADMRAFCRRLSAAGGLVYDSN